MCVKMEEDHTTPHMTLNDKLVQYATLRFKLAKKSDLQYLDGFGTLFEHTRFESFLKALASPTINSVHVCSICDEIHVLVVTDQLDRIAECMQDLAIEMPALVLHCKNDQTALYKSKRVQLARDMAFSFIVCPRSEHHVELIVMV